MGEYGCRDKGDKNARRGNAFKTTQFMDRKPIRNRKKVII